MNPKFLTLEDVLSIHAKQLSLFGGTPGVREQGLLESAISQPRSTFGGEYLHPDLFSMASAYLFHLIQNHAFIDGNKRTGLLAALVFLKINGVSINKELLELYDLTMAVAQGQLDKEEIAKILKNLMTKAYL